MARSTTGFNVEEATQAAEDFFGHASQGLAEVLAKAFNDLGKPQGFIMGEERAGALVVGLRYGQGVIRFKDGPRHPIYWQSPSIGFDAGGQATKVFMLVYGTESLQPVYDRFLAIDGSLFVVGGLGLSYTQRGQIAIAPIRTGVGLRGGVNIGYLKFTSTETVNPF